MKLKKVSDLPNAKDIKSGDLMMLVQQNAEISTSLKITVENLKEYFSDKNKIMDAPQDGNIYGRKNGEWVLIKQCTCDKQIKTIDLTEVSEPITILDYIERDDIKTFSDMMLDYMNDNGITDYKSDKFYAEYVPELVDTKIESIDYDDDWDEFFEARGFIEEKVRTVHIKDKKTDMIVANVKYIGDDDDIDLEPEYFENIAAAIVPKDPNNIDYYIKMLNCGIKNGISYVDDGEPVDDPFYEVDSDKILSLIGFPFDNKRLQLGLIKAKEKDGQYSYVDFVYCIDLPTGFICADTIRCYGEKEWVINPEKTK